MARVVADLPENSLRAGARTGSPRVPAGTRVPARIPWGHQDRLPLGDLAGTILPIILTSPNDRFRIDVTGDRSTWRMDIEKIKRELGEVPPDHP